MSRPPTFTPPACATARVLHTERGDFAVLDAVPTTPARATALLLPGYTGSKEDFIALLEPLSAAGYRVIAVDGRGQYESEGADRQEQYAQGELARDVLAQAAALTDSESDGDGRGEGTGEGGLHLLGHSLGGQIARAAVLLDATPFRSLTLMSSGPAEVVASQREKVKMLSDALSVLSMDEVWQAMQALDPPQDADTGDGEDMRRRWMRHDPAQLIATGAQLGVEPDRVDELAAVGLPVHVLSGERDDVWPVELFDAMARRLDARRTTIAGAEHSPNTARPQKTAKALATFWDTFPVA
ncbi:alpha/beta hydrolase [Streptomyces sp. WZ.A104]|uniref:alpha/beta fold hydrolase n=1 Tax=Streptomyces sp. WZ.A104 TaxID=2023771 RepID=UPI000BBBFAB8|nr:alpha/beta hydrolase [Streptomyces sp. WZ.A104]PCG81330.1 alpha/beta hydrolase [Streptomyces sp. WZ.A104]